MLLWEEDHVIRQSPSEVMIAIESNFEFCSRFEVRG